MGSSMRPTGYTAQCESVLWAFSGTILQMLPGRWPSAFCVLMKKPLSSSSLALPLILVALLLSTLCFPRICIRKSTVRPFRISSITLSIASKAARFSFSVKSDARMSFRYFSPVTPVIDTTLSFTTFGALVVPFQYGLAVKIVSGALHKVKHILVQRTEAVFGALRERHLVPDNILPQDPIVVL